MPSIYSNKQQHEVGSSTAEVLRELDTIFWDEYCRSEQIQLTNRNADLASPVLVSVNAGVPNAAEGSNLSEALWGALSGRGMNALMERRFWSDARWFCTWMVTFFDPKPSCDEQTFRLFYLLQQVHAMAMLLPLNLIILLGMQVILHSLPSLSAYAVPILVHTFSWLAATVLCLVFLLIQRCDPSFFAWLYGQWPISGGEAIDKEGAMLNPVVQRSTLRAWMEVGQAIILLRVFTLVMRMARYGTSIRSVNEGEVGETVPLCLEELELEGSGGDGSFSYMLLLIVLDVFESLIFSCLPFPVPWGTLLCVIEMLTQLVRLNACADRIDPSNDLGWVVNLGNGAIVTILIMVIGVSPIMKERSARSILNGFQWQSKVAAERRELVQVLVSVVKAPVIELQRRISEIMKKSGISERDLDTVLKGKNQRHASSTSFHEGHRSQSVLFVADMQQRVMDALSMSDNLLLLLRVDEGKYRFDAGRNNIVPADMVCGVLGIDRDSGELLAEETDKVLHRRYIIEAVHLGRMNSSTCNGEDTCDTVAVEVLADKQALSTDNFCVCAILRELVNIRTWSKIFAEYSSGSTSDESVRRVESDFVRSIKVECLRRESGGNYKGRIMEGLEYLSMNVEHRLIVKSGTYGRKLRPKDVVEGKHMCVKHYICRKLLDGTTGGDFRAVMTAEKHRADSGGSDSRHDITMQWKVKIPFRIPSLTSRSGSTSTKRDTEWKGLIYSGNASSSESIAATLQQCVPEDAIAGDVMGRIVMVNSPDMLISTLGEPLYHPPAVVTGNALSYERWSRKVARKLAAYSFIGCDSVTDCAMLRKAPYRFGGSIILFSNNITFITEDQSRLVDLLIPLYCEEGDLNQVRNWMMTIATSSETVDTSCNNSGDGSKSVGYTSKASPSFDAAAFKATKMDKGTIDAIVKGRVMTFDESYYKWRLLNPSGAIFNHANILTLYQSLSIVINLLISPFVGVSMDNAIVASSTAFIQVAREVVYKWILRPNGISLHWYWNAVISVSTIIRVVLITALLSSVILTSDQLGALGNFVIPQYTGTEGDTSTLYAMANPWVPHWFFLSSPGFVIVQAAYFCLKCIVLWFRTRPVIGEGLVYIFLWMYSLTNVHHLMFTYLFERLHHDEFLVLHKRLLSTAYFDTAMQYTLSKVLDPLVVILNKQHVLCESIVARILTRSLTELNRNLRELEPFHRISLNASMTLTKLEFFDAVAHPALCMSTESVLVRAEVVRVLQLLNLAYGSLMKKLGLKVCANVSSVLAVVRLNGRLFRAMLLEACTRAVLAYEAQSQTSVGANYVNMMRVNVTSKDDTFLPQSSGGKGVSAAPRRRFNEVRGLRVEVLCMGLVAPRSNGAGSSEDGEEMLNDLVMQAVHKGLHVLHMSRGNDRLDMDKATDVVGSNTTLGRMGAVYRRYERLSDEGVDTGNYESASHYGIEEEFRKTVRKVAVFDFPYYLSPHSYLAFNLIADSSTVTASVSERSPLQQLSNDNIVSSCAATRLRELMQRRNCKALLRKVGRKQMLISLQKVGLLRKISLMSGVSALSRREVRSYDSAFRQCGCEYTHTIPVSLPRADTLLRGEILLIDTGVDDTRWNRSMRNEESAVREDPEQPRLSTVNVILKARLCGFQGLVVVLAESEEEYAQVREGARVSALAMSEADLVLYRPLTKEGISRMCILYDEMIAKQSVYQR